MDAEKHPHQAEHTHNTTHSNPTHPVHAHETPTHHATHTPAPATNAPTSKAWVIGLVIVLLLAVLGFVAYQKFFSTQEPPTPTGSRTQVKLLVDAQCTFCDQNNSILIKLAESNIAYEARVIDVYSEEGQSLAKQFDVNVVPTALISVVGLDQNVEIQYAMQRLNPTKNGFVVFPEAFLDNQPRVLTYLGRADSCSVEEGKIRIDAYVDFACKPCAEAYFVLKTLENKYSEIDAHYIPVQYRRFTQQSMDIALNNNRGALCAEQMGYYRDYIDCAFLNIQFGGVQDTNSMKACLAEAGGRSKSVQDQFTTCVRDDTNSTRQRLIDNMNNANALRAPAQFTPAFVFDCKYSFVGHNDLPLFLCVTHPNLEGCDAILSAGPKQEEPETPGINIYVPDQNVSISPASNGTNDAN